MSSMYNLQADGLSRAILRSKNPKLNLIAFEPLMLKKSELKALQPHMLIALGKKLPQVYIYRKGGVVGQAKLGQVKDREVLIISAKERVSNLGKPESKYSVLECRIAILPKREFVVGKLVLLPKNVAKNIQIFMKQTLIASAALLQNDEEYFLQINEVY